MALVRTEGAFAVKKNLGGGSARILMGRAANYTIFAPKQMK
jgi:hypothetical protein